MCPCSSMPLSRELVRLPDGWTPSTTNEKTTIDNDAVFLVIAVLPLVVRVQR